MPLKHHGTTVSHGKIAISGNLHLASSLYSCANTSDSTGTEGLLSAQSCPLSEASLSKKQVFGVPCTKAIADCTLCCCTKWTLLMITFLEMQQQPCYAATLTGLLCLLTKAELHISTYLASSKCEHSVSFSIQQQTRGRLALSVITQRKATTRHKHKFSGYQSCAYIVVQHRQASQLICVSTLTCVKSHRQRGPWERKKRVLAQFFLPQFRSKEKAR